MGGGKLREMIAENSQLRLKIEALERDYDKRFSIIFEAIKQLLGQEENPRPLIGFDTDNSESGLK